MSTIEPGSEVCVHVEILHENGDVVETSDPEDPIEMRLGEGVLPDSVEQELVGKRAGDVVDVLCPEGEAFGDPSPEAIVSVPHEEFPDDANLEKGDWVPIEIEHDDGSESELSALVMEISPDGVILDANHPLAGQPARFRVKVEKVD